MNDVAMRDFIHKIPKVELHLHIEGTLEPELMFALAERNGIKLPYQSVAEVRAAYKFHDLQSFLDIYYQGASVLVNAEDFYDLTSAYLRKAASQNVVHTEIFFDPQTHTARGIEFATVMDGITRALDDAVREFGITSKLIMCFLRHLSEEEAFATLQAALPYRDRIVAVGLDSSERGNSPSKFQRVFALAREHGFLTVAHAGEEGVAENIREALYLLHVSRIDHGYSCVTDAELLDELKRKQIPLTMCPLSNLALHVFADLQQHPLKKLLDAGLCVTVNSDDPAYFGGYIEENFLAVQRELHLTRSDIIQLVRNAIQGAFLDDVTKSKLNNMLYQI